MKIEEVLKLAETISIILHQTDRDDLIVPLIQLVDDYERINDEIATFVHCEVESTTSSDESSNENDNKDNEEDNKFKVDEDGFHSIV